MSDTTIVTFPAHGALTLDQLGKLPTGKLVELYNAKAAKIVTSTPTKAKFIPKVWALYAGTAAVANANGASKPKKGAKPAKEPKAKKEKAPKKERARKDLNFPGAPADERKHANKGSRMETLLVMAASKTGVSEEEFKKASKAKDRFRAMIAWANEGLGWGFKEIEPGRVKLVDGAGRECDYVAKTDEEATE